MTKSPNHHNRLYCTAQPLGEKLCREIVEKTIAPGSEPKERARKLVDEYGWNPNEAKKIWCFGPERGGPNLLVDGTHGEQFMSEIKDSAVAAFQWATDCGVLCEENLRGCRFDIVDVVLHADTVHRGAGQLIPAARRVFAGAQLTASPRLVEPVFLVDIQTVKAVVGPVYSLLHKRRGEVVEEVPRLNTPIVNIRAHLPVVESFGFVGDLRAATAGRAFPQCVFDHWSVMVGNPLVPTNANDAKVCEILKDIRKRKGLPDSMPPLDHYIDKL
jgi:elongation factor 2